MTQRKRWLKTREFEKGECVAVRRPGKADTDRNAKRPPFVCVLVWVYFVHERFESGFRDLTLCIEVLRSGVFGRIGRLVGDQERNKSSYSHTKFDIHPRERRQMLSKCQLILATGGTVAQDLTTQWSTMSGFMQELSLMVIDEGQQYGTDREIAVISLLKQQPLVLWTGDSEQTPGGIDRAARNAKRSRQLLLSKKHGLRSDRHYYMPLARHRPNSRKKKVTDTIICQPTLQMQ